jgi:HAD superfamily hydrolase (TIGR01450 family)
VTKTIIVEPIDRLYKGYALDLDGTVYIGDHLLDGAQKVITTLRENSRVVFVTNKPLETAESYAAKLTGLGIPTETADIVTPLDSLVDYLDINHGGAVILTVAEPLVDDVLRDAGFQVTGDPLEADVVVVSFDRTFTYAKLFAAYRAVNNGAVIIATNPDPFCPTPEGGLPDCAAMLAAVEACTGATAEAIVGKPSAHMGRAILGRLNIEPADAVMVGDRLLTDIAMGQSLGMASVLILTGVSSLEDIGRSGVQPDFVIDKLLDLLPSERDRP